MAIQLTARAAEHVRGYYLRTRHNSDNCAIRLGIKPTGCSGLAYVLQCVEQPEPGDLQFDSHGVSVFVDPKSYVYVEGTLLDYVKEGLQEGFKFENPNVQNECGCGESFTV